MPVPPSELSPSDAFAGWPPEALSFLEELEADNDREWFHANRARYEQHVAGPARALGQALAPDFGAAKVFRPFNDVRFHPGPAIKEHVGIALGGGGYVQLSLDGVLVAAGLYRPDRAQLERLRRAIDGDITAKPLQQAITRAARGGMELGPPDLKRAPRGYPLDHPRIDLLRHKRLVVSDRLDLGPWLHDPAESLAAIRTRLTAAKPLVDWLIAI